MVLTQVARLSNSVDRSLGLIVRRENSVTSRRKLSAVSQTVSERANPYPPCVIRNTAQYAGVTVRRIVTLAMLTQRAWLCFAPETVLLIRQAYAMDPRERYASKVSTATTTRLRSVGQLERGCASQSPRAVLKSTIPCAGVTVRRTTTPVWRRRLA